MKKIIVLLLLCPILALGQSKKANSKSEHGIHFENNLSWIEILEKAKKENKYIFVDCYTTWCAPCRWISANIFPLKNVGDYMNAHFISVKVQMDKTSGDSQYIKKWYKDAAYLMQQYQVRAFPTALFFTSTGEIVHRTEGTGTTAKYFLDGAAASFDPTKAYYKVMAQYMNHRYDWKKQEDKKEYLYDMIDSAFKFNDSNNGLAIADTYIKQVDNPWDLKSLSVIYRFTRNTNDKFFPFLLANVSEVSSTLKISEARLNDKLKNIVVEDEVIPQLYDLKGVPKPVDWAKLDETLAAKYPVFGDEISTEQKVGYFKAVKDTSKWEAAIEAFMEKYGQFEKSQSNFVVNNKCWDVFTGSNNQLLLNKAIEWMQPVVAGYHGDTTDMDWETLDTYSNLLYKTGNKEKAILWEKNAISLVGNKSDREKKTFEANLSKMEKGVPTWK